MCYKMGFTGSGYVVMQDKGCVVIRSYSLTCIRSTKAHDESGTHTHTYMHIDT